MAKASCHGADGAGRQRIGAPHVAAGFLLPLKKESGSITYVRKHASESNKAAAPKLTKSSGMFGSVNGQTESVQTESVMDRNTFRGAAAAATISVLAGIAAAQGHGGPLVRERQDAMKDMAEAAKTIAGMFEGRVTYSGERLKHAAETVRMHAAAMKSRFPDETLKAPSVAKEKIASDREEFNQIADRLEELAATLSLSGDQAPDVITQDMRMGDQPMLGGSLLGARTRGVEEDPANMPAEHVFHLMLETCTSCHAKFRERQQ